MLISKYLCEFVLFANLQEEKAKEMKMRKEEEEIQKEMAQIRKEMDEERRKKAVEELRYGSTVSLIYILCHYAFGTTFTLE